MPPIIPNPARIKAFATEAAFEEWLAAHHDTEPEVWIKIHKKGSGLATVTYPQALDVALCWGWIDAIKKSLDERSFLQRFTPRGRKSIWSQINQGHVERLIAAGRMTEHGQRQVDAAKADGRWAAAYAPMRQATIPDDLRAAIEANKRALKTFATLDKRNLFALRFRVGAMKTPQGGPRRSQRSSRRSQPASPSSHLRRGRPPRRAEDGRQGRASPATITSTSRRAATFDAR